MRHGTDTFTFAYPGAIYRSGGKTCGPIGPRLRTVSMQTSNPKVTGRSLLAVAAVTLALGGCSSTGTPDALGTFSTGPIKASDLANIEGYTADQALAAARDHFRMADFGYSTALYKRYLELAPNDPQGYIGLAASYDRLRRFDLSDRVYASWYRLSGGTAQYYNNLGYSYLLRGDTATALVNLRKARALDPQNPTITNNLKMLANEAKTGVATRPQA